MNGEMSNKKMNVLMPTTSRLLLLTAIYWQSLCVVFVPEVLSQDYVDECPEPNGFYADAVQCDRYYECQNSQVK